MAAVGRAREEKEKYDWAERERRIFVGGERHL